MTSQSRQNITKGTHRRSRRLQARRLGQLERNIFRDDDLDSAPELDRGKRARAPSAMMELNDVAPPIVKRLPRPKKASPQPAVAPDVEPTIIVPFRTQKSASRKAVMLPKPPKPPRFGKGALKAEQTVTLGNGTCIDLGGLRDGEGVQYVWARQGHRLVLTRYSDWHGGGGSASVALRDRGIVVVGSMGAVREGVDQLKRFPRAPIVTRSGWSSQRFMLPDGRAFTASGEPEPFILFEPLTGALNEAGTLEGWREQVAAPLADHKLASFLIMAMFAAPLLRLTSRTDNFGFELCGAGGTGKSTLQLLMASAAGPAIGGEADTYWRPANATINAIETVMPRYNDLPLILDEAGLLHGGGKADARAVTMRALAFSLSAGTVKQRFGDAPGLTSRLIYVLSTNVPLVTLSAGYGPESEAIADRLLTLSLPPERTFGVFDDCPAEYVSIGLFADGLKRGAAAHYGHALPAFLRYVVECNHQDPGRLRRVIQAHIDQFVARCGADANNGSQLRVASGFGLVYAAGRLARRAQVLPRKYRPGPAALAAYRLHRTHGRAAVSLDDRLRALIRHASTIDLQQKPLMTLSDDQVAACPVFLYVGKTGRRELLIPGERIDAVFPDWKNLKHGLDVQQRLRKSSERWTVDRPLASGGKKRTVYCFDITDLST